jgi:hypothetical protein
MRSEAHGWRRGLHDIARFAGFQAKSPYAAPPGLEDRPCDPNPTARAMGYMTSPASRAFRRKALTPPLRGWRTAHAIRIPRLSRHGLHDIARFAGFQAKSPYAAPPGLGDRRCDPNPTARAMGYMTSPASRAFRRKALTPPLRGWRIAHAIRNPRLAPWATGYRPLRGLRVYEAGKCRNSSARPRWPCYVHRETETAGLS